MWGRADEVVESGLMMRRVGESRQSRFSRRFRWSETNVGIKINYLELQRQLATWQVARQKLSRERDWLNNDERT